MSQEQKPPEKSLADQRVDKILSRIEELKKEMEQYKPPIKTETHSHDDSRHFQETDLDNVTCPNCKKNIETRDKKIKAPLETQIEEDAKKIKELRDSLPYQCDDCHGGLTEKEALTRETKCPTCGKDAKAHRWH
jgi:endogenous inhibitor of DNA gyrase (YacG/DUF329 family)